MAKNYKDYKYFESRPDVVKIFDDLDAYLDYCRFELCEFNPADLYRKDSKNYQNYLYSKNKKRKWNGNDRNGNDRYHNDRPRYEKRSNGQNFSR